MYKLVKNLSGVINIVQRLSDNTFIPFDTNNQDYAEYLAWLEAGNTPTPADEPTA